MEEVNARVRAHFIAAEGWPRHVANETALEFERLQALRAQAPDTQPDEGSLLGAFARQAGLLHAAAGGGAAAAHDRYRQRFGHPPPYPWRAGAVPADPTPAVG